MSRKAMRYYAGFIALYDLITTGDFYRDRQEQFSRENAKKCVEYVKKSGKFSAQIRELELDARNLTNADRIYFFEDDCLKYYLSYAEKYKASRILKDFISRDGRKLDDIAADMLREGDTGKELFYMANFARRIPVVIIKILLELEEENPLWMIEDFKKKYKERPILHKSDFSI